MVGTVVANGAARPPGREAAGAARPPGRYGIDAPWVPWMWAGYAGDGRCAAVIAGWRVLAPGGTMLVVDIRRTREYAAVLTAAGAAVGAALLSLDWRVWWSGPWMSTSSLMVTEPARSNR